MKANKFEDELYKLIDVSKDGTEFVVTLKAVSAILAEHNAAVREAVREFIEQGWGPRCKTKDTSDFPELKSHGQLDGRCATCFMWEAYDDYVYVAQLISPKAGDATISGDNKDKKDGINAQSTQPNSATGQSG